MSETDNIINSLKLPGGGGSGNGLNIETITKQMQTVDVATYVPDGTTKLYAPTTSWVDLSDAEFVVFQLNITMSLSFTIDDYTNTYDTQLRFTGTGKGTSISAYLHYQELGLDASTEIDVNRIQIISDQRMRAGIGPKFILVNYLKPKIYDHTKKSLVDYTVTGLKYAIQVYKFV